MSFSVVWLSHIVSFNKNDDLWWKRNAPNVTCTQGFPLEAASHPLEPAASLLWKRTHHLSSFFRRKTGWSYAFCRCIRKAISVINMPRKSLWFQHFFFLLYKTLIKYITKNFFICVFFSFRREKHFKIWWSKNVLS